MEDEELVALAVSQRGRPEGDAAVKELFGRHRESIYLWCRRMVRDHERALDLAQEAQINAWRRLDAFSGRSRFRSWLFVIVRNRCLSALRPVDVLRDPESELDGLVDPSPRADEELVRVEDEQRLRALMRETLEPEEHEALSLRCFERMPVEEITRVLGLDNRTGARGLLQKARRKLRGALERSRDAGGQR